MNKYCHERWRSSSIGQDASHATFSCHNPPKKLQGMTNNVGLTFSVGDIIPQFTINIEQDDYNW
jgi:hypothetical protein